MPVSIDDMKKITKNSVAAGIIADNEKPETENIETNVSSLIGSKTFENNFKRKTYYVHNSFAEKIDKMVEERKARGEGKGVITRVINDILEEYFKGK